MQFIIHIEKNEQYKGTSKKNSDADESLHM